MKKKFIRHDDYYSGNKKHQPRHAGLDPASSNYSGFLPSQE